MTKSEVMKLKICLIGDGAVGKTSLISRYIYNQFDDKYLLTLGTKTSLKKLPMRLAEGKGAIELQMNIWDIMGQKEFERLHKTFFRGAQGAIIVTDITRKETLLSVEDWVLRLVSVVGDIPMVFVANKTDLMDQSQFKPEELQVWATRYNSRVYQCSAKTGQNIEDFFFDLGKVIVEKATGAKVLPPEQACDSAVAPEVAKAPSKDLVELVPIIEETSPASSSSPTKSAMPGSPRPPAPAPSTEKAKAPRVPPPPPPDVLPQNDNELKEMRGSITNLNRSTQQLQQQISALQKEITELRTQQTDTRPAAQQLQPQISALQNEIAELRTQAASQQTNARPAAQKTDKSGQACPKCLQPASFITQYKRYYCYKCKDYL